MKRIVIATDGSDAAREAVRIGLELAKDQDAEVTFVYVVPRFDPGPMGVGVPALAPHRIGEADQAPVVEAERIARAENVRAQAAILKGDPVAEIVTLADSIDADLIVIGSRGHGAVASVLLGSVSLGVMHETRRPVVVVRASETPAALAVAQ
jgi:nucleotide-binding universal stress UspA family protein